MPHRDGGNRCTGCGCPEVDCPISDDDAEWTTDANGNHDGLCCEDCWHPADPHPQENPMSTLKDKATALLDALKAEGHHLAALAEEIVAHLKGDETQLQTEAETDAAQVEHDAAPVVAEAKADAEQVAEQAVADAKQLADGTTPPASA